MAMALLLQQQQQQLYSPPPLLLLLLLFFFLFPISCNSSSYPSSFSSGDFFGSEVELVLGKIKASLQGTHHSPEGENLVLSSWNASVPLCQWRGLKWARLSGSSGAVDVCGGGDPSSPQWFNASLYKDPSLRLVSLQLPSTNLSGAVPRELAELSALRSLDLRSNSLSGGVPPELGYSASLSDLDLSDNFLTGILPTSIWNLCAQLVSLRLHANSLVGALPEPPTTMTNTSSCCDKLEILDLGRNRFSGEFPEFVTRFAALKQLDLGDNMLAGAVPPGLVRLKLERLNLARNNLTGALPAFPASSSEVYNAAAFEGNDNLCGPPLGSCRSRGSSGRLSSGAVAGIVISLMSGAVVLASLLIGYLQGMKRKALVGDTSSEDGFEQEEDELDNGNVIGGGGGGGGEGKLFVFQGGERLTLEDVLNATGQVIEKTSYGSVYKAKLADGGTIDLRLLREGSCKDRMSCLRVIKQLGRVRHENLLPLRAFYQGKRGEKLLISDYLPNRTLHDVLHETKTGKTLLNWARRHKIALGIARGLAHLHTGFENPIIHGNVRSKNVLVDEFFIARLTEFGLDKLMVPAIADEVVALAKTDGYKAPELQKMNKCNSRTDVYAFGILLLEILLGKKPGKNGRTGEFMDLPSIVKGAVLEETTMEVFDRELLKGIRSPMEDGLVQALKLAMGCCAPVTTVRPTMDEVVKQLEENRPRNRSALYSPTETRSEIGTPF